MTDETYSIRVYMDLALYQRLCRFADYHGLRLSRACKIILDSAPLDLPQEITDEVSESDQYYQLQ